MSVPDVLNALWRKWIDVHIPRAPCPHRPLSRHGLYGMLARLSGVTHVTSKT